MKNKTFTSCLIVTLITAAILLILGGAFLFRLRSSLVIEQPQPKLFHPTLTTQSLQVLSPENSVMLDEISVLTTPYETNEVIRMIQSKADYHLLVVYGDGMFRRWDLENLIIVSEYDFYQATSRSVNFSEDGELVITPGKVVSSTATTGYTVWDTSSGTMVKCWGKHCPNASFDSEDMRDMGLVLDPSKKWIIDYGGSTIGADGLLAPVSAIIDLYDHSFNLDYDVSRLVFDPSGNYIAYALEEGEVKIYRAEDFLGPIPLPKPPPGIFYSTSPRKQNKIYGIYNQNSSIETIDLGMDPTRSWLAWLTEDELTVWNLNKTIFARAIQFPLDNGKVIAFDRNGNLLAIGTDKGIILFDLSRRARITELSVGKVTALYFSLDNRLLIWGDTVGNIHLLGVK